jgi:hypothetical protein
MRCAADSGSSVRCCGSAGIATEADQLSSDAARSSMPAFVGYTFEPGPGLPALPTNSTGYHFPTDATVDVARVEELAAALGVEGDVVAGGGADVDGLSWRVGPDDGTAPMLTVGADAQLGVNYSSAWADATTIGCSEPVDAGVEDPATGSAGTAKPDSEAGTDVGCVPIPSPRRTCRLPARPRRSPPRCSTRARSVDVRVRDLRRRVGGVGDGLGSARRRALAGRLGIRLRGRRRPAVDERHPRLAGRDRALPADRARRGAARGSPSRTRGSAAVAGHGRPRHHPCW